MVGERGFLTLGWASLSSPKLGWEARNWGAEEHDYFWEALEVQSSGNHGRYWRSRDESGSREAENFEVGEEDCLKMQERPAECPEWEVVSGRSLTGDWTFVFPVAAFRQLVVTSKVG